MPATPPGTIGAWNSSYLTKFLNDWLRRNPLPAQDQLTIKKLKVTDSATAPTPIPSDNSTNIATTAWVQKQGYLTSAPAAPVSSVFGRTGAVVAVSGDYTAAQVTNAADKAAGTVQAFSSHVSTGPLNNARATVGTYLEQGTGRVLVTMPSPGPTSSAFATAVLNDVQWRWTIDSNGQMTWGAGTGLGDTTLYRDAANSLSTDDRLRVNSNSGILTVSAVNNNVLQNYYANGDTQPAFKLFAQGAMEWGAGGTTAPDIELARLTNSPTGTGSFLEIINGDGFGFGNGTGGTASVAGTSLTLSKPTGQVTFTGQSNSANVPKAFTVTNTTVGADDVVHVSMNSSTTATGSFVVCANVGSGSFTIVALSSTANTSVTYSFNFVVLKGARA